ncbi:MAG: UDP-N-acetylglucosamine 2-epimerase (non-hydrolyzing) [Coriobacteriia bacterium]|nr:UDP-N-acetylglucosamine 2-epimerase (non-hydrolyzing) [Coriobacteriia bacterium]MCL2870632.1 UDP-N-acetylglucosamine 2-epimerase (non-hydrolyzing) [Coriobacteriia bacterium]
MPKKILSVIGTRPEAIKMAPIIKALEADPRFESHVLATAQHREMLDQVLDFFEIAPDYDLDLMRHGQTLPEITSKVLLGVTETIDKLQPDIVLVHGDTTTTFAAAIAAFYQDIPVGHIEAGMRTGDMREPFPEEMNRTLVASLATWHFAPSQECIDHLVREGIDAESITRIVHNTGVDALLLAKKILEDAPTGESGNAGDASQIAKMTGNASGKILVTAHRRESWGAKMREIFLAVSKIAQTHPELTIEVATHANPLVADDAVDILGNIPNVILLKHQSYAAFVQKMASAQLILSDSGGIQEEGPTLGVPVVVLRDKTEYHELLDAGVVILGGTEKAEIVRVVTDILAAGVSFQDRLNEFAQARSSQDSTAAVLDILARG